MNWTNQYTYGITLLFMMVFVGGMAQNKNRIEIEMKTGMSQPLVVSAKGVGLVIIERIKPNILEVKDQLVLSGYDTEFTKLWSKEIPYNRRLNFIRYEAFDEFVYLIFGHESLETLQIVRVDIISGDVKVHNFSYFKRFIVRGFCARDDKMYVAGLLKQLPIVIELNLTNNKISALPLPVDGKRVNMQDIYFSRNGDVTVSLAFEKEKSKSVLVKSYRADGTSADLVIAPEVEYALLNGKMTQLGTKSGIVIGTYAYRNSESTQGFYIGGYYDNNEVFKKYHSFSELDNFFSFLSEKSQSRVKEKIKKKESQGKELRTKYRLLVHDVLERKNDYIMLSEAYYPVYRTERVRRYTARGYYYESRTVFDGYQYTHAVVVAFSKKGEILWDHSFKITDTKLKRLRERVTMNQAEGQLTLVYTHEGNMHKMIVENNEVVATENEVPINTGYDSDQVKQSSLGDSEYWYDNHFLAWGVQKIRNLGGEADRKRRNVFYINKLSL